MTNPAIDSLTARRQHEFLKAFANRINTKVTKLGLQQVLQNDREVRRLIAEITDDTREIATYLDMLTEKDGYLQLQAVIEQQRHEQQKLLFTGGKK